MTITSSGAEPDPTPDRAERLATARERTAGVYPQDEQLRAHADQAAADVLTGTETLASAGARFVTAREGAQVAQARLVGAMAAVDGTLADLANQAGLSVDDVANVLGRGKVTVLARPGCVQCDATSRALTKKGIDFVKVDVADDPTALEVARGLGYLQVPVVVTPDGDHWSGFRPDRIGALPSALAPGADGPAVA